MKQKFALWDHRHLVEAKRVKLMRLARQPLTADLVYWLTLATTDDEQKAEDARIEFCMEQMRQEG